MLNNNTPDMDLATLCAGKNSQAQQLLYKKYSGKMMALCLRYASKRADAEDLLQEGFITVFRSISQYRGVGSLEGWIRSIIVHMAIRKWHQKVEVEPLDSHFELNDQSISVIDQLSARELMHLIAGLPAGYRIVFNMFVIDGYSHAEIAALLGIKESTSRSQLLKARLMLQKMILALNTHSLNKK